MGKAEIEVVDTAGTWTASPPGLENGWERDRRQEEEQKVKELTDQYGTDFEGYLAVTTKVYQLHFKRWSEGLTHEIDPELVDQMVAKRSYQEAYKYFMIDQGGDEYSLFFYEEQLKMLMYCEERDAEIEQQLTQGND